MIRPAKLRVLQKYHLDISKIRHHLKLQISAIYVNQGEECDIIIQRGGYSLEISHGSYHFLNESKPVAAFAYLNRLTGGDMSSYLSISKTRDICQAKLSLTAVPFRSTLN